MALSVARIYLIAKVTTHIPSYGLIYPHMGLIYPHMGLIYTHMGLIYTHMGLICGPHLSHRQGDHSHQAWQVETVEPFLAAHRVQQPEPRGSVQKHCRFTRLCRHCHPRIYQLLLLHSEQRLVLSAPSHYFIFTQPKLRTSLHATLPM